MTPDHISELFAQFRPVTVRRLFGGAGLYADGVMFGLISRDVIYLKADKGGKRAIMSFWRMPERLYDDPDELATWAEQALAVARVAGETRPKSKVQRKRDPRRRIG